MSTEIQKPGDHEGEDGVVQRVTEMLMHYVGNIPTSTTELSENPKAAAQSIANAAAIKAASTAGLLALPPGPLGWVTILPEIVAVWKIQGQMVADIAGVFGKKADLSQEQMLYCLFKHSAAQAVRDLVVRAGERFLVREASLKTLQMVAKKIGLKVTQKALGKGISRWIPVISAMGVGGYAWYDTANVAKTAIELFEREIGKIGEGDGPFIDV